MLIVPYFLITTKLKLISLSLSYPRNFVLGKHHIIPDKPIYSVLQLYITDTLLGNIDSMSEAGIDTFDSQLVNTPAQDEDEVDHVKHIVNQNHNNTIKWGTENKKTRQFSQCAKYFVKIRQTWSTVFRSRWIGLLLGPLYGVFVYVYFTHLILSGPPCTASPDLDILQMDNFTNICLLYTSDAADE